MPFDLSIRPLRTTDGLVELALGGVLDASTATLLRDELQHLFDEGVRRVVLDLSQLSFLDSAGLGVLVGALRRYHHDGGRLDLRSPSRQVCRILDVTGVAKTFGLDGNRS